MTVGELMELLEGLPEDAEVRLATQPSWPFEHAVTRAELVEGDGERVLYLAEGDQLGYLPGAVSEALGWA